MSISLLGELNFAPLGSFLQNARIQFSLDYLGTVLCSVLVWITGQDILMHEPFFGVHSMYIITLNASAAHIFCLFDFFFLSFFFSKNFYVHFPHWFTTMCPQHDSTGPNQLGKVNSRQFVGSHEVSVDLFTSNTHTRTFKTVFKSRRHVLLWPAPGYNIREVDGRRHVQSI